MSTSSPAPTPSAASASSRATVPEAGGAASAVPRRPASSRSRAATSGPWASCPERTTRATRSASSSVIDGREWGISAATPLLEQATLGPSRARGPRYNESKVQQQPNGLEGLGVLHARLDPTEVGGRDGQLEDRQVLDVGLGHLRAVRLQARELLVQHLLDVGEAVRREIDGGRPLVEEEVRHVARGGERALGEVAVVLLGVVGVGADGEDVHSGLVGPGVAVAEDRKARIAVHQ